jgi:DDE superfamily endonuclease
MPLNSKLLYLSELRHVLSNNEKASEGLVSFFVKLKFEGLCKVFDDVKTKGYEVTGPLLILCLLQLSNLSVWAMFRSGISTLGESGKDVYYRLKNNPMLDWRKLLLSAAKRYNALVSQASMDIDNTLVKCFILDDSSIEKTGYKIEFIGKVFNHVSQRMVLGYKMLTLGYWDGKSLIGIDFSIHREKGKQKTKPYGLKDKQLKEQYSKQRPEGSPQSKRVKELGISKIDNAIKMLKRAVKNGFKASYVLTDSWFMSEKLLLEIRGITSGAMHLLGMCKMDKRKYLYEGRLYTAKELLKKGKKRTKRARKFKAHYVDFVVEYKGTKVKLFFSHYSAKSSWNLLLTTDLGLNYIRAIEIYQIRWTIEVFFKETKQYLGLGKTQSNDFDAHIADITLIMVTHIVLSLQKRFASYETMGALFHENQKQLLELTLWERLWGLFIELMNEILEFLGVDIETLIENALRDEATEKRLIKILQLLDDESKNAA